MHAGRELLTTAALSVGYRERLLFSGLNVALTGGEMICFMGPNGAGKSSLLRTLAGLQPPLAGRVILNQHSESNPAHQVAVVLTDRIQALQLTVEQVIGYGRYPYLGWNLRLSPDDRDRIDQAIARVRLESLLGSKLYTLSDGQLQMVMIARAVAQDTPVILLDEPTAHLDLNNRLEVMNLLRSLAHETGKAILLATHELDLALQTADKVWLTGTHQDILSGWPEDLVLNGAFDEIFQMKGFDLKTGKVRHSPFRNATVQLAGDGPAWWWTKNALERHGYAVTREDAEVSITVVQEGAFPAWTLQTGGEEREMRSIEELMKNL